MLRSCKTPQEGVAVTPVAPELLLLIDTLLQDAELTAGPTPAMNFVLLQCAALLHDALGASDNMHDLGRRSLA